MIDKIRELAKLAALRRRERAPDFFDLSEFHGGLLDTEHYVSPWTKCANNVNADLMIIGQDWASSEWLLDPNNLESALQGRGLALATNPRLDKYLSLFGLRFSDTYATNAFVFIKKGSMRQPLKRKWVRDSAKKYVVPQIEIVRPRMVICLGSESLNAVRHAFGEQPIRISEGHRSGITAFGAMIFGTYHVGGLGTANAGGEKNALDQWNELSSTFSKIMKNQTLPANL